MREERWDKKGAVSASAFENSRGEGGKGGGGGSGTSRVMFPPVLLETEGVRENLMTRMRKVKKGKRRIIIKQGGINGCMNRKGG